MIDQLNTKNIINFQNVDFKHKNSAVKIFDNANCSLNSHHFYILTGNSGSGKTTFLQLIYRKLIPTKGDITVLGINTKNLCPNNLAKLRQKIGLITYDCQLFDHLSVKENIILPLKISNQIKDNSNKHVNELIEWIGLSNFKNSLPYSMSSSEKLNVITARAIIKKPKIIIVDEIINSADEKQISKLFSLFYELSKKGTTIIIETNNRNIASTKGSCEIRIRNGNIISQSSFIKNPHLYNVMAGIKNV